MKHIIASSYESSILSEPTQYFMEIVQEYGATCFMGLLLVVLELLVPSVACT